MAVSLKEQRRRMGVRNVRVVGQMKEYEHLHDLMTVIECLHLRTCEEQEGFIDKECKTLQIQVWWISTK